MAARHMLLAAAAVLVAFCVLGVHGECTMPNMRPPAAQRSFVIPAVDARIAAWGPKFKAANLATLFANTLPNTLDTTATVLSTTAGDEDAYVITGDINASWLRDSTNQVLPYIEFAAAGDANATALLRGVLHRQAAFVLLDPYANAFHLPDRTAPSPHTQSDATSSLGYAGSRLDGMDNPYVFERKWEVDSLANFLHLSALYFNATGDTVPFAAPAWQAAVASVLRVFTEQQQSTEEEGGNPPYLFQRTTSQPTDSLSHGRGWPAARTGMIKTGFRPSDDAHVFPYLVPANALAVVALRGAAPAMSAVGLKDAAATATKLASEVDAGIRAYGVVNHTTFGSVYAYEVDGFGNALFMDDGNIPSLMSLPLLGYVAATDATYQRTRSLLLSPANPYYFSGPAGAGVGSPHTGVGNIWPMGIIARALTSSNESEVSALLDTLVASSACTGLIHESFSTGSASSFTRPWFAWVNGLFGSLVTDVAARFPSLVFHS